MARITQWERRIGRRLRLRDLFVFFAVVDAGSMTGAARQLGVSTPSVSDIIGGLEQELGVRLLDRSAQGIMPTPYGRALLARGQAAFDELHQGVRDIEFITDPGAGEVRIGCPESLATFVALVIERLGARRPRLRFSVQQVRWPTVELPDLQDRKIDLVVARLSGRPWEGRIGTEFDAEILFDDPFSAVVGRGSRWARRRRVDLAELIDAPWVLTPLEVLAGRFLTDAFAARGLAAPRPTVETSSIHLRNILASGGRYIAVLPRSVLRLAAERYGLKELPIRLSDRPSPVGIVTLRGRNLTPAVEGFIGCAREVARSFTGAKKVNAVVTK
jgi:DNA-binding transcriptional LysR family regulator